MSQRATIACDGFVDGALLVRQLEIASRCVGKFAFAFSMCMAWQARFTHEDWNSNGSQARRHIELWRRVGSLHVTVVHTPFGGQHLHVADQPTVFCPRRVAGDCV